jgi:glycosyltransferase involved in cell wall biosynthesis
LTDCLESLAYQTMPPWEVVVVDDGSTNAETMELCARLPHYYYPFQLRCLHKPNGGLSSARNYGIRHSCGDVILPLDADDKLTPDAIEEYTTLFASDLKVDICYPDQLNFGNDDRLFYTPLFNRWRLTQENIMVYSSAIRRRVFDAGYWYDEEMRGGYEDWEFWMRTCALGPFRATPLRKAVFVYRRWGYSMVAAVNSETVVSSFRRKHRDKGIWSPEIEQRLRTMDAPTHRAVCADPSVISLPGHDIALLPEGSLEHFLKTDPISRFLWLGSFPREATAHLQLIVNEVARHAPSPVYLFMDCHTSRVYLTVLDRLAVLAASDGDSSFSTASLRALRITTSGDRQPYVVTIGIPDDAWLRSTEALALLCNRVGVNALPEGFSENPRVDNDLYYYYQREPAVPSPVVRSGGDRILAIAMPWLTYGGAEFAVRILLQEGTVRRRFDKIILLTFEKADHAAHHLFEQLADAVLHLGQLPGDDERRMAIALKVLESGGITDFLIVNSRHGYELIPHIRKAGLAIRISAQLHSLEGHPLTGIASEGYPRLLASQYAPLVDRVASISDHLTSFMTDHLYFPHQKIKTVRLGVDQGHFRPPIHTDQGRPKRVVWCGRLSPEKDPLLALRVAEHFHRQAPDIRFVFVGDGPLADHFSGQLQACLARGVPVEWIPRISGVNEVFRESDCLFMTSLWEGIPIVVLEALSTGIPVVTCFANTAMKEIVASGQCFEVNNRLSMDEYCQRLRQALDAPPFSPDPALSHHRYAQEMIDWLFPTGACARQDYLTSVFGVTAAA